MPAWYTATTPGIDAASLMSTELIVPWATLDRTSATYSIPGLDEVVDVLALAGEQRRILQPQHRIAQDRTRTSHVGHPLIIRLGITVDAAHYDGAATDTSSAGNRSTVGQVPQNVW